MAHYPLLFGPLIIGALAVFVAAFYAMFFARPVRTDTTVAGCTTHTLSA